MDPDKHLNEIERFPVVEEEARRFCSTSRSMCAHSPSMPAACADAKALKSATAVGSAGAVSAARMPLRSAPELPPAPFIA